MSIKTFSPKELAEVLGVSESSIKRWSDAGLIPMSRTAGGHRRIELHAALRFIRNQGMRILRPDLIGLPDLEYLPPEARAEPLTADMLFHLLKEGHAARARGLIATAYLDGTPLATLFDSPMAGAMHRLGELWITEEDGIFREHAATSVCLEAINQVRLLIPPPLDDAPLALGGAPERDPYLVPTSMAATVLTDAGYRTVNLGAHTPPTTFRHAAETHHPHLVWIAIKNTLEPAEHTALIEQGIQPLLVAGITIVIGGEGALAAADTWPAAAHLLESMEALADFVEGEQAGG